MEFPEASSITAWIVRNAAIALLLAGLFSAWFFRYDALYSAHGFVILLNRLTGDLVVVRASGYQAIEEKQ